MIPRRNWLHCKTRGRRNLVDLNTIFGYTIKHRDVSQTTTDDSSVKLATVRGNLVDLNTISHYTVKQGRVVL